MRLNAIAEAVALHGRARIDDEPAETRFTHQPPAQPDPAAPLAPQIAQPPASSDPMAGFPPADPRILAQAAPPPAPPPAPTASAQQLAMVDLALSDPLNRELIQAYAPNAVTASGDIARDQVALYGAERFGKMQQLAQATASVRDRYIAALDAAQQNPPIDPDAACPPGWHWETDQPGRDADIRHTAVFDVDAFTSWYAKQDTLASRAFASLYGGAQTSVEAHGGEQIVSSTSVGNEMFHVSHGYWSQIGEHGEKSGWVGSSIGYRGGVTVIDAQGHPDLIDNKAVWFDPAMGFVTATENIKQHQNFFDKALPSLVAVGITAVTAGAGAFASVGSLAGASGSLGATMLSAAAASAFTTLNSSLLTTGSVHLKDILKSALTGAVTAGVTNIAGLDKLGLQGNTVVSYTDRAIAITGQATLQGALQQLAGGKFKEGFTAGLASGLAAEVTRGMQASIDTKLKLNQISGAEASAYRLLTQATGSAIRMMSNPGDPGHAMAQDFLGSLVQDGATAVGQSSNPMSLDQLRQSEITAVNAQTVAVPVPVPTPVIAQPDEPRSVAPTTSAPSDHTASLASPDASISAAASPASAPAEPADFRTSERDYRATHDASVSGASYRARPGDTISTILGTNDPQAVGNFLRANGLADSAIVAGQNYFVPDDRNAYGDSSQDGQAALNGDRRRLGELSSQRSQRQQGVANAILQPGLTSSGPMPGSFQAGIGVPSNGISAGSFIAQAGYNSFDEARDDLVQRRAATDEMYRHPVAPVDTSSPRLSNLGSLQRDARDSSTDWSTAAEGAWNRVKDAANSIGNLAAQGQAAEVATQLIVGGGSKTQVDAMLDAATGPGPFKNDYQPRTQAERGGYNLVGSATATALEYGGLFLGLRGVGVAGESSVGAGVIVEDAAATRIFAGDVGTEPIKRSGALSDTAGPVEAAPGAINLMKNDDPFFVNASKRSDVDPDGFLDVIAHGNETHIEIQTSTGPVLMDAKQAAQYISGLPEWKGQNIRLLSCSTGACMDGFAAKFQSELGVSVVRAPSDILWADANGGLFISSGRNVVDPVTGADQFVPTWPPTGKFVDFTSSGGSK